jgi:hypothetical protein
VNGAVNRDYDDILRRALRAAAESVEPSADGLERIRERLGYSPLLSFSSIAGWFSVAAVRFTGWAVPAFGTACEIFWALVDRFRPLDAPPGHVKPGLRWLRPMTAAALALFVIAGGAFAAKVIPSAISAAPAGHSNGTGGSGGSVGATGQGAVHGSSPFQATPGSSGYTGGTPSPTGSVASKCHLAKGSTSPTISPTSGAPSSSPPTSTSSSPGPTSTSPTPTTTTPSPSTSDSSPSEPSSGTTGTPGAATSSPDSTDPDSSGSAGPGAPSPSATTVAPGDSAAGSMHSSTGPCPSSSPTSKAPRKVVQRMLGLGQPALVITSSGRTGRFTLPSGRSGESY